MENNDDGERLLSYLRKQQLIERIEKLENEVAEKEKLLKEEKLTHIEQMLILDYLGVGKNINVATKKANLYGPIIRRDIETTRQKFSELYYHKNDKESLTKVRNVFEDAGLFDLAELVKKDIGRKKL